MTNEEKARKICKCNSCTAREGCTKTLSDSCFEYKRIMKMAKWKDEQWKDSATKLLEKLESKGYNDRVKTGFEIFYDDLIQIKK